MSRESKTNGTERLRTIDAAAAGREDLEVIELFRVAKTKVDHALPLDAAAAEAAGQETMAAPAPSRMQMLETADAARPRPGVMLPEEARWMRMDTALRGQFRARQKRAVRRRLAQPYVVAALVAAGLAALAFALVMAWQGGGPVVEFFQRLLGPEPAAGSEALGGVARLVARAAEYFFNMG